LETDARNSVELSKAKFLWSNREFESHLVRQLVLSQLSHARASVEEAIKSNPFAAVALAAGFGFLYGVMRR